MEEGLQLVHSRAQERGRENWSLSTPKEPKTQVLLERFDPALRSDLSVWRVRTAEPDRKEPPVNHGKRKGGIACHYQFWWQDCTGFCTDCLHLALTGSYCRQRDQDP